MPQIADKVLLEIRRRLKFLVDVGLDYLTLGRLAATLSGGEAQRIQLATNLGSLLVGTLYVLDEPSIGLHPRDNSRLIKILENLRDIGNTVIVVEHDEDTMRAADHIIDIGVHAGEFGGELVYEGNFDGLLKSETLAHGEIPSRRGGDQGPAETAAGRQSERSRSSAHASTISRTSPSRSRSICLSASPAFRAPANRR